MIRLIYAYAGKGWNMFEVALGNQIPRSSRLCSTKWHDNSHDTWRSNPSNIPLTGTFATGMIEVSKVLWSLQHLATGIAMKMYPSYNQLTSRPAGRALRVRIAVAFANDQWHSGLVLKSTARRKKAVKKLGELTFPVSMERYKPVIWWVIYDH